jgi:predicted Zn-dependent protease
VLGPEAKEKTMPGVSTAAQYNLAVRRFETGDYAGAATVLADVVEQGGVGTLLLLARAYYHSDQLVRAEETARAVLARAPSEAYAHLLLGRALQRQNRAAEATGNLRLAAAMDARLAEFAVT